MNQGNGKKFHWGRNGKGIGVLLIALLLSGLFGCGKKEAYTVSIESQESEAASGDYEENVKEEELAENGAAKSGVSQKNEEAKRPIYVHICGAVKYPGVYEFSGDTRVFRVVEKAGGLLPEAYEAALNQARVVKDGERIYVPTCGEWEQGLTDNLETAQEKTEMDDGLVNINTADEKELCTLPGVGETRAKAIIEYRNENGSFGKAEDIQNVPGIKSGLFSKIKDLIKVK